MQCAACHHSFDVSDDANVPAVCPECGSKVGQPGVAVATDDPLEADGFEVEAISFEQAEPVEAEAMFAEPVTAEPVVAAPVTAVPATAVPAAAVAASHAKRGVRQMLNDMILALLFVGSIVAAGLSTWVALQTMKERDELKVQAQQADQALAGVTLAAAEAKGLAGGPNAKAREQIFAPAISYFQDQGAELRKNPEKLELAAAAYQRSAGLQAKSGKSGLAGDLQSVGEILEAMRQANYDVARFPSLYQNALKNTTPLEWGLVTDTSREAHGLKMLQAFQVLKSSLGSLSATHPQAAVFHEDLAGLFKISGSLQTLIGRESFAMDDWANARDHLEALVRDQPGNADYQARLAEALTSLSNLQRKEKKEDAIASLKRAVEVREQMAQAKPEDKSLADELAKAKNALAKLSG